MQTSHLVDSWDAGGEVSSIAVSSDGIRAVASCDRDVTVWNTHSGQRLLGPLKGHSDRIWSVAFSPDERMIASGSWDTTIRIWDIEKGTVATEPLTKHSNEVNCAKFLDHGRLVISGSDDRTICVWDVRTRRLVENPIHAGSSVWSIAISPDDRTFLGACQDGTIKAFDMSNRSMLFEAVGHSSAVRSVIFSPNGGLVASGSCDKTVRIWDAAIGHAVCKPLGQHNGWVNSVAFSSDGRHIVSGSQDQTIKVWDVETGAMQNEPTLEHAGIVYAAAFAADSYRLISGSGDKTVKIWNLDELGLRAGQLDMEPAMETPDIENTITSNMAPEDILSQLGARGCIDMTDELDLATCSERPISSGGFGDIYRCRLKDSTQVAIKTIRLYEGPSERDQKVLKYAARELYTWSKCRHINVQPLLGLAIFRGQIGMIARWETNGSLPQYLEQHADTNRCTLATQIAEGLSYLHDSGVIHGDLKGANVLVSRYGVAQLADFGNAVLNEYTLMFSKTSTKESLSPRWAAPELFRGAKCSVPADIYALGMTMLETMTGEVPYSDKTEYAVMFAVMFEKVIPGRPEAHIPTDSEQGDSLWSLLKWCWEFEMEKRPSAADVARVVG